MLGIDDVLGIIFVILKLTGNIDWSWWWVVSPWWIGAIIAFFMMIIYFIAGYIFSRD